MRPYPGRGGVNPGKRVTPSTQRLDIYLGWPYFAAPLLAGVAQR